MPPADQQQSQNNQVPQTPSPVQPNGQQPVQGVSAVNPPVQTQVTQQNNQIQPNPNQVNLQTPEMQVNQTPNQAQAQQIQQQNIQPSTAVQPVVTQPQVQQQAQPAPAAQTQQAEGMAVQEQSATQPVTQQQTSVQTSSKSLTEAKKSQTAEQMNMKNYEKDKNWIPKISGKIVSIILLLVAAGWAGYTHYNDPTYFPNEAKTFLNGDYGNQFISSSFGSGGSVNWNSSEVTITESQFLMEAQSKSSLITDINITSEKVEVIADVTGEITPDVPLWLIFNLVPIGENGGGGLQLESITFGRNEVQPSMLGEVVKKELVKLAQIPEAESAEIAVLQLLFGDNYASYTSATSFSITNNQMLLGFTTQQNTNTNTNTNSNNSNNSPAFDPSNSNNLPSGLQEALQNEEDKREGIDEGLGDAQNLLDEAGYEVDVENFGDNFGDEEEESN